MGIAVPDDIESSRRSNLASATYTAIALVFFFGIGLAGGAAYKVYFGNEAAPQIADQASPPHALSAPPAIPPQNFAATKPSDIEKAAPDLARIEPTAPAALAPPPAPAVPTKPGLPPPSIAPSIVAPSIVQAAPPPTLAPTAPPAAEPTPAPPDLMTAVPSADATPPAPAQQEAKPETPTKPAHVAAIPPKKPAMVAKAHRPFPNKNTPAENNKGAETVALHPPPTAPGNVAGPYRVQFGAFANEDNARRVQWAIEATGLKVEVSQEPGPSGHPLYFLRSPAYSDYAAALSAAQTVQHRVNSFVNAVPIDYAILGDHSVVQQAQR
jgi:hypothetical protein